MSSYRYPIEDNSCRYPQELSQEILVVKKKSANVPRPFKRRELGIKKVIGVKGNRNTETAGRKV